MRDDQHQAYIRQLLSHLKKKKNLEKHAFFKHISVQIHSSVGMTPVHLLDTHIMRTTCLDLKAQGPDASLCALNTVRHFQVLDLNAGCILIHH